MGLAVVNRYKLSGVLIRHLVPLGRIVTFKADYDLNRAFSFGKDIMDGFG